MLTLLFSPVPDVKTPSILVKTRLPNFKFQNLKLPRAFSSEVEPPSWDNLVAGLPHIGVAGMHGVTAVMILLLLIKLERHVHAAGAAAAGQQRSRC